MILGQYEGKISVKSQIAFPKKFREGLGERLIITKGLGKRLMVVSEENWKTLLEGTEQSPFINKEATDLQRFVLANAQYVELDSKGRCVLPEYLRKYAGIREDIVYAGMNRFVEIWDKKNWDEEQDRLSSTIELIAQKLVNPAQERQK
ncbi:MAG TPA: cell division/cell wall cluster transcriptional repressor MraZ [Patescibacteria group bacterium]|nr:cell division/cell wall cluster transcriptional repressor MraZ [Patescibacteria group bacterium]